MVSCHNKILNPRKRRARPPERISAMPEQVLPLYARLRNQLRAQILDGRYKPNDRLPSESELTVSEGVSRITVRQALGDLEAEGLIVRQQGRGAFVAPVRASQTLNRLQGLGEALSGLGQVNSKRLSSQLLPLPVEAARLMEMAPGTPAIQLVGLRYLDRQPLSVNVSWFPREIGERIASADLSTRDILHILENDLGRPLRGAELEITAEAMPAREARLLRVAAGVPALRVRRLVRSIDGEPLHLEKVVYRSDTFSYRLNLTR